MSSNPVCCPAWKMTVKLWVSLMMETVTSSQIHKTGIQKAVILQLMRRYVACICIIHSYHIVLTVTIHFYKHYSKHVHNRNSLQIGVYWLFPKKSFLFWKFIFMKRLFIRKRLTQTYSPFYYLHLPIYFLYWYLSYHQAHPSQSLSFSLSLFLSLSHTHTHTNTPHTHTHTLLTSFISLVFLIQIEK